MQGSKLGLVTRIGFLFIFCSIHSHAQQFSINCVELAEQNVILHYDLLDSVVGRSYTLRVYGSHDNFINPLQNLSGDAGMEINPGRNKKIIWDAKTELGPNYEGSVALEIRGRLYIPFIRFSSIEEYKALKRGKPYQLTWSGGAPHNILNFDLFNGDKKVTTFSNIANVGSHTITLPSDTKPGKNYRFRISDSKNKDEVIFTGTFSVKRKIPLLLKVLPAAILGYAATLVKFGEEGPTGPTEIPDPIEPN